MGTVQVIAVKTPKASLQAFANSVPLASLARDLSAMSAPAATMLTRQASQRALAVLSASFSPRLAHYLVRTARTRPLIKPLPEPPSVRVTASMALAALQDLALWEPTALGVLSVIGAHRAYAQHVLLVNSFTISSTKKNLVAKLA
jgi:hypothetical protein